MGRNGFIQWVGETSGIGSGGFDPNDLAATFGYAREIGHLSVGLSAKFIQSKIVDSAQTAAVDIGALSPTLFREKLPTSAMRHPKLDERH